MIKKLLAFCTVFIAGTAMMMGQHANIGMLGGSMPNGWGSDVDMVTTDGIIYTLNNVVISVPPVDPGVKFRQDDAWSMNWGGSGFPSGTASQNGPNIPAANGTWDVTFNKNTGAYTFLPSGVIYDQVSIVGSSSLVLSTADGITYTAENAILDTGDVSFRINDATVGWGSPSFPTGVAVLGQSIPVLGNSYNITFNKNTGAYSFNYVTISLIGAGVVNWDTDVDLSTTNGFNYTLSNFTFAGGEAKFRLNHVWTWTNWGGTDFPVGTGNTEADAPNFVIVAGTYNVMFDRISGEYMFMDITALRNDFSASVITVHPNPTQNVWNFNAGNNSINSIRIADVTGKEIFSASNTSVVDATSFAAGIYFAKVTMGNASQTIRLIKN
ncbi:T9SS type A sorting domain-containing protein [Flavobacterium sp. Sd200]|uniref:T9SS type A sorting domain-containing protein n=1 Tax=Flavobacterium sp. Sd200 TaxID=2692211 RepID=UPI00136C271D|nr:T9SS type A sorting domain-containing protein [Flavobacterium sp. Sd200]MXN91211.1 T9SS type A sorting domain-containing protein [Flavobacterium sp. Sd200]